MLIVNGRIVPGGLNEDILTGHTMRVSGEVITHIDASHRLVEAFPGEDVVDANGQLVMPGAICAHTHFYGAYARGMAIPGEPPSDFPAILRRLWWPLDKALDRDAIRASARVMLADAVRHGTTTLFDHHASPNAIDGSLNVIADAVDEAGLRAVLCYEVSDRDGRDKTEAGIAENLRFMSAQRPRVRGTFGLHASMTLSEDTLRSVRRLLPPGEGVHIHVAEHEADEAAALSAYNERVVQRLSRHNLLNEKTILAHCVHVDERECTLIEQSGAWVSHQPRSNMNNGVGAMAFDDFMRAGLKVCLGTDGFTSTMWADWKAAYLMHKLAHRDPRRANGADIFQAGMVHNARLAQNWFGHEGLGQLRAGAPADFIFVDYHPFTPLTGGNLPWHILFGFEPSMVTATAVAGKFLMRDRVLLTMDERAIAEEALALAPGVWDRYWMFAMRSETE
jgi:putative selenium metabolism protein SsnA